MSQVGTTRVTFLLRLRDRADELSWQEFHDRYGHLLYRYARGRGASHADAEDIVQEIELSLFKAIDRFEYDANKGRFRAYLRSAVVHAMGRRAEQQARQPLGLDPRTSDALAEDADKDADAQWELEWRLNRLRRALHGVAGEFEPTALRAFELHVLADRSVNETAAALGISKWSVYRARDRVLKRLKTHLDTMDPDGEV